ncbi:alginate export family protein [Chromatocurvus halotolerans]|uniref:alginate export family protein n=1 Tax=Chromatocurvus halotolerans TaxID=1132028 RepID=UPI0013C37714|nr:alginate export family protein [Chromatocurvus halotolerans]
MWRQYDSGAALSLLWLISLLIARPVDAQAVNGGMQAGMTGSYRARVELLENPFRPVDTRSDHLLVSRLLLHAKADAGPYRAGVELQDSRAFWFKADTPLGTDDVNALEPLQAYVGLTHGTRGQGGELDILAGRFTLDYGSRRLLARNNFRNTSNAFTGVRAQWQRADDWSVSGLYTSPNVSRASDRRALEDNEVSVDAPSRDRYFWGVTLDNVSAGSSGRIDAYLFGLRTAASAGDPSDRRQLFTLGARARGDVASWTLEWEGAVQYGRSRDGRAPQPFDLDHRAWFVHASARLPLDGAWEPGLSLRFDAASGDEDPGDGRNQRFDKLFGARAFELGPSGFYGLLTRSNLLSPGARLDLRPWRAVDIQLGYRAAWLESRRDVLPGSGLGDARGASGRFIGHQWELSAHWTDPSGSLQIEAGVTYLDKGGFLNSVPGNPMTGNTAYGYTQATYTF